MVLVVPGTFEDAELYSLGENGDHGKAHTAADKQKALTRLLDNPKLLARVVANVAVLAGLIRALAVACQVSKGMVGDALRCLGLRVTHFGAIVPAAPPSLTPTPADTPPPADGPPDSSASSAPGEELTPTPSAVPTASHVAAALAEGEEFRGLARDLAARLHRLDKLCLGPACTHMLRQLHPSGEPFIRTVQVRRGQVVTTAHTLPPLVALAHLLKRVAPARACAACRGNDAECPYCRGSRWLPGDHGAVPTADETPDLFDGADVRDVWDG